MKIAIILGNFSVSNRPLDFWFNNINVSSRGLTGTDLATVMLSKELSNLGNEIHLFTCHAQPHNKPTHWENVKLYNIDEKFASIDDSFDAIISINDPADLKDLSSNAYKICWQFLNDFTYCAPGFDDHVDLWLSPCNEHMEYLKKAAPRPEKWKVLALGCDPDLYQDKRIYGRMIWCSSADRGLHNLLEIYPEIKKAVPEASLRIFYHFSYGNILNIEPNDKSNHPHVIELGQRLRYIKEAAKRLAPLGVEHLQSASRETMAKEFSEASVFPYSIDTVALSEGFSVSTLEAHASFTVPVITSQDCIGSIYRNSGSIMIDAPVRNSLKQYTAEVIKALTDKNHADSVISKCREFAKLHSWKVIAKNMNDIIINR